MSLDADVAFALEGIPSVHAVYVLPADGTYLVSLRPYSAQAVARVHYALLDVLGREGASRVRCRAAELHTAPIGGRRLAIDEESRIEARSRAAIRASVARASEPPAALRRTVLIVGPRMRWADLVVAVAPKAQVVHVRTNGGALERLAEEHFDAVLWCARAVGLDLATIGAFAMQNPVQRAGLAFVGRKDELERLLNHFGDWVAGALREEPATDVEARALLDRAFAPLALDAPDC